MNSSHEIILNFLFLLSSSFIIFIIYNKNISPLNLMMTLIMFTLIILIMNYLLTFKSLYNFMIFISMISGNMIMFLYFTSLINNYYNKLFKSMINYMFIIMIILLMMLMIYYYYNNKNINYLNKINITMNIFKIYTYPLYLSTLMLIFYLLLTLLLTMKICLFKYKPLRKIFN